MFSEIARSEIARSEMVLSEMVRSEIARNEIVRSEIALDVIVPAEVVLSDERHIAESSRGETLPFLKSG